MREGRIKIDDLKKVWGTFCTSNSVEKGKGRRLEQRKLNSNGREERESQE